MKKFGTAAILCGGKSSRMGFDKSSIKVGDKLLIEIIGEKLEEVFEEVILISNDRYKFQHLKYKVYEDLIPNIGPMAAIYSALNYASSEYVFVTACDMPVMNISFINHMMELIELNKVDGIVACKSNYIEPLYAFYSKNMIKTFEMNIKQNNYKLLQIIKNSKVRYIEENEVRKYSSDLGIFTNLNYQADIVELNSIILEDNI